MASAYEVALLANDKVAPEFVKATAKAKDKTNTITLEFNEPIDITSASVTVNGAFATLSAGSTPNGVVVTTTSNLEAGKTYNLKLMNFKDYAANYMANNPLDTTVTVEADTVAPNVVDVKFIRDSLLEITFDKSMDASTMNTTNVKLLNASDLSATGITLGAIAAKPYTDNKVFDVTVTALNFNTSGVFNGVVVLTNSINDASGNALTATTRNVSVTKDTTKPQVVSATYKNVTTYNTLPTANGAIVVKFSEPVTAVAAATAYSVVNDAGTSLTTPINSVAINPLDDTELVLSLSTAVASTEKSYLVLIPSGAVTDKSLSANANDAVNQLVDVSAGVPVAADTTAPAVASVTPTAATSSTSGSLIAVTFTEADSGLDLATVINTNNYRLDGMPLPTGSYITVEGTVAKINIPAGRIAADKIYILTVSGIKDKAGNVMSTYVNASDVTLKDDIRPVLTTATLNANGTVSLGFSEGVNTAVGKEADFVVILNGVTLNSAAYTLADGVGAEAGKYVLSVKTSVEEANGSTITNDTLYIDVDGSTTFNAGDIIVSQVADATTSTGNNYTAGTYNLNNASSLTIKTVSSPTLVADVSALANKLVGNTQIVVK